MNVEEAILTRRSVRRFLPKPVPEPVVRKIIEVSARAPSGHNIQPWKVYAIAGEVKDRLCADILKAAETEPDKHRPEYEYYPTEWHEPYIGRRRELGYDLYAKLGIARDDVAARTSQMNRNYLFFAADHEYDLGEAAMNGSGANIEHRRRRRAGYLKRVRKGRLNT